MSARVRCANTVLVVLGIGAAATLGNSYFTYRSFIEDYPEEAAYASWIPGGLFLFVPYLVLAVVATRARRRVVLVALAVELLFSALFEWAAASDAQGALIILWLAPLQWIFAILALFDNPWLVSLPAVAIVAFVVITQVVGPLFAVTTVGALGVVAAGAYAQRRRGADHGSAGSL